MSPLELMSESFSESLNKAVEMIKISAEKDSRLLEVYHSMNDKGQEKALDVVKDLAQIPAYQLNTAAAQTAPATAPSKEPSNK